MIVIDIHCINITPLPIKEIINSIGEGSSAHRRVVTEWILMDRHIAKRGAVLDLVVQFVGECRHLHWNQNALAEFELSNSFSTTLDRVLFKSTVTDLECGFGVLRLCHRCEGLAGADAAVAGEMAQVLKNVIVVPEKSRRSREICVEELGLCD